MSTVIAWSTGLVSLVWLAESLLSQAKRHHRSEVKQPRSWLQAWPNVTLGLFAIFCISALPFQVGTLDLGWAAPLLQVPGILLAIAAAVVGTRAKVEMGEQFAAKIQVWTGQQLVTDGLYSLVRHPIYMSTVALWMGAGLGMLSWLLMGMGLAIIAPTLYLRARKEEQLIRDHFGLAYRDYQARVPMLLPWPRPHHRPAPAPLAEVAEQPNVAEQE